MGAAAPVTAALLACHSQIFFDTFSLPARHHGYASLRVAPTVRSLSAASEFLCVDMTLAIAHAGANGAMLTRDQENELLDELFALQLAIVEGKKPQYRLSAATLKQLRSTIASAPREDTTTQEQIKRAQPSLPGLPSAKTASGIDPIFLEKSDSLIRAEGRLKRQRIEREVYEQVERRKHTWAGERDGQTSALDVDNVLAKAQAQVPPVSGLKPAVPQTRDDKSSFDENDYYSSQVESEWSADGVPVSKKAFTADFEQLDTVKRRKIRTHDKTTSANATDLIRVEGTTAQEEDDYIPEDPVTGNDGDDYVPGAGDASDYEPGEISQGSNDYTPEYAPPPATNSPQTHIAHNRLTQIAAPQPERVSPLTTTHKNQNYELELVNGKPEMVKKPRSRYDTDNARQSSASPPANNRTGKRQKSSKKRKRDTEQTGRSKKRDRRSGLDTSAQYPQMAIKAEPVSPMPYIGQQQPHLEYRMVENQPPIQFASAQQPGQYYGAQPSPLVQVMPQRATSVMAHRIAPEQDLRRVATLHHAQPQLPPPSFASPSYASRPMSPYVPQVSATRLQNHLMGPPPSRLQETSFDAMMPPPAPKRVVVDQFGNRYYAAEPEPPPPIRASVAPEIPQFERAPSSLSSVFAQPAPYDPANPRIEYAQPTRIAATPSYQMDAQDDRMSRVRNYLPQDARQYTAVPTSPVFDHRQQHEQTYGAQSMPPPVQTSMLPPSFQYVEPSRQMAPPQQMVPPPQQMVPPPQMFSHDGHALAQAPPRAYSVQPEFFQQMPAALPPRQGSVAPVQYIRQSVQPEQSVRYVDARGYEIQPGQNYRQY